MLLYTLGLFVMTMIAGSRGASVWLSSVKESFGSSGGAMEHPMTQYTTPAPPQFHTVGPHQGVSHPAAVAV